MSVFETLKGKAKDFILGEAPQPLSLSDVSLEQASVSGALTARALWDSAPRDALKPITENKFSQLSVLQTYSLNLVDPFIREETAKLKDFFEGDSKGEQVAEFWQSVFSTDIQAIVETTMRASGIKEDFILQHAASVAQNKAALVEFTREIYSAGEANGENIGGFWDKLTDALHSVGLQTGEWKARPVIVLPDTSTAQSIAASPLESAAISRLEVIRERFNNTPYPDSVASFKRVKETLPLRSTWDEARQESNTLHIRDFYEDVFSKDLRSIILETWEVQGFNDTEMGRWYIRDSIDHYAYPDGGGLDNGTTLNQDIYQYGLASIPDFERRVKAALGKHARAA